MNDIRSVLRNLPTLVGCEKSEFNYDNTPEHPVDLFLQWLNQAIDDNVPEAHLVTLTTVDHQGMPDARALILKDLDHDGWYFAISNASPKGQAIIANPNVSLLFYWSPFCRQIRIQGKAVAMDAEVNKNDFLSRSEGARALALAAKQSSPLTDESDIDNVVSENLEAIKQDPSLVSPYWTVYRVEPQRVEFWQGDRKRRHKRLRYETTEEKGIFSKTKLWP